MASKHVLKLVGLSERPETKEDAELRETIRLCKRLELDEKIALAVIAAAVGALIGWVVVSVWA